jgi:hypothetical protein
MWFPGKPRDGAEYGVAFGKSAPAAPPAPDPLITANAQGQANENTARVQASLNRVNQNTPFGSSVFTNLGGDRWQQDVTLPEALQQAVTSQQHLTSGLYGLGNDQLSRISANISQPFSFDGMPAAPQAGDEARQRVEDALYQRQASRLDPQFKDQESGLQADLANRGIVEGSDAYSKALRDFNFNKTDAYQAARDSAIAAGGAEQSRLFGLDATARDRAIQEATFLREQPLNEASALMSGGQIGQPQFSNVPQVGVAPTDVIGAYGLQQAGNNAAYQGQVATTNSGNQATAGLAAAGLTAAVLF